MASDNEDEEWGNYDVNDSDEEDEAPLSEEAQRRQQEERKTWAPRRPKPKPRNQRPLSFSERNKLRRNVKDTKKKKVKAESPVLIDLTLNSSSSSSSSAPLLHKKAKSSIQGYDDDDASSSSSSSSENDEEKNEEEEEEEDKDDVASEEMGGDPLYLVYDDISAKKLWMGKDSTNPYLRSVNKWVEFNDGHTLEAINTAQGSRADRIAEVYRVLRCVPLSSVLEDKDRYPHLMVPLRTVFVAFAFYDSDNKDNDGAVTHPDTLREIQDLPLTLIPSVANPRAVRMFTTILVTLIRGHGRFRPRDVFSQVAKYMPPVKYSPWYQIMLSLWDRENTFFFAVDRTKLPGLNTRLWGRLEVVYSTGLFDNHWLHAPALLQHMLQLGLVPEKRTKRKNNNDSETVDATGGAWTNFLTKGLYDPRIFLFVSEFLDDRQDAAAKNAEIRRMIEGEWVEEPFFDAHRDRHADIFQEYWNVYFDRE